LIAWLENHLFRVIKVVFLDHLIKATLVELVVKQVFMLVKDMLVHKLLSLELLQAVLHITLIDLSFI